MNPLRHHDSKCGHVAVGVWYCGLLECALQPVHLNSELEIFVTAASENSPEVASVWYCGLLDFPSSR